MIKYWILTVTIVCNVLCAYVILNDNNHNTKELIDTITQRTCEPWDDCK